MMKAIKIMSFNLWCGGVTPERTARVFAAISDCDPDILGVQEATPQWMQLLKAQFPAYTAARRRVYRRITRSGGAFHGSHYPSHLRRVRIFVG